MRIIGLTGRSGAGKSTVAGIFESEGMVHIDCDRVTARVLERSEGCKRELAEHFGPGIFTPDGAVDRRALGAIVFSHSEQLEALNRITHKYILEQVRALVERCRREGAPAVVVDGATIIESGYDHECDLLVAVTADKAYLITRIMQRDRIGISEARARLEAQKPDDFYTGAADITLYNDGSVLDLQARAKTLARRIMEECSAHEENS